MAPTTAAPDLNRVADTHCGPAFVGSELEMARAVVQLGASGTFERAARSVVGGCGLRVLAGAG